MARIPASQATAWLTRIVRRFEQDIAPRIQRDSAAFGIAHIVGVVVPETQPYPPVDTGAFRAGFRVGDEGSILHVNPKLFHIIDKGVPKENVKVSRKMIDALTFWVQRKFAIGDVTEARQVAIQVANAIKRRGLPPKEIVRRALPVVRDHMVQAVVDWWTDSSNWHA